MEKAADDVPAAQDEALPSNWSTEVKKIISLLPAEAKPGPDYTGNLSYAIDYAGSRVGVWLKRRCFYVYKAKTQPKDSVTKINKMGGLTVGWKSDAAAAWEIATSAMIEQP